MASPVALEIVDLVFQNLMKNNMPFGGKVIVLGGDFRQVLPVVRRGNRVSIVNSTIKKSDLWNHFQLGVLEKNMRAINDPVFSQWLLEVVNGKVFLNEQNTKTQYSVDIPTNLVVEDLITEVFGSCLSSTNIDFIVQRAILCPKNEDVRDINEKVLQNLVSEEISLYSIDSVKKDDGDDDDTLQVNFPVKYLNSLNPTGLPPYKINLKKGCIIMLLRNLAIEKGFCNGVRMVVKDFSANCLKTEIITGPQSGTIHFIPRISLDTANDPALPFNFVRHQFPVRLSYAMTINKPQGQTFQKVGLYLPEPCFTHGQLYTALSRATDAKAL